MADTSAPPPGDPSWADPKQWSDDQHKQYEDFMENLGLDPGERPTNTSDN